MVEANDGIVGPEYFARNEVGIEEFEPLVQISRRSVVELDFFGVAV